MVGVAQLVRVPDCDSGCRGFESHRSPHFLTRAVSSVGRDGVFAKVQWTFAPPGARPWMVGPGCRIGLLSRHGWHVCKLKFGPLAQLVEQLTLNQRVGGSSPPRPTIYAPCTAGRFQESRSFHLPAILTVFIPWSCGEKSVWPESGSLALYCARYYCECGGTGRRAGFRFQWGNPWEFESLHSHHLVFLHESRMLLACSRQIGMIPLQNTAGSIFCSSIIMGFSNASFG